ncbi:hypothetical protein CG471_07920 [Sphingobium sp. IP1]|uniref:hypothetical protein n=1 Tax=Sphingobium sp. IP1 TaxID=2021637 RepID=UPI000C0A14D9|nr:hypothetical protein [Sphingobium sp. IP1]PHP20319.1 hypothetical protein CG471_07920 [Sphingobium sp. IP1]
MMDIPSRLSIDDADIDWDIAARLRIELNGTEQHRVVAYDAEAGWVDRHEVDVAGDVVIDRVRGQVSIERVTGLVVVSFLPEGGG